MPANAEDRLSRIEHDIAELKQRNATLERMLRCNSSDKSIQGPTLEDAINAASLGDVSVLDEYLKKGGQIPSMKTL